MTVELMHAPFPLTYRELWLPRGIKGWGGPLPSSRYNGHELTFTGARHGTTADGVHFDGAATSNINCGAIHNASAKLWISFRFKLDQPFSAASAIQYLWGKFLAGTDYCAVYLAAGTGRLTFVKVDGGATSFAIDSGALDTWNAGQWYHVLASISDVNAVRLRIDNGVALTDADVSAMCNGGDFVIGDQDDPGAGLGLEGVIADFFCEEGVDLTLNQEADLSRGIAPVTADNRWLLDEGRGVTAYDRGVDGNNGTLDATATWAWGRVKQPIISLDGRNDHGQSSAGVDVSGAITIVWCGKFKAHYDGTLNDHYFVEFFIDNNNHYQINNNLITGDVRFLCTVGGASVWADLSAFPIEIDDYGIFIGTVTAGGVIKLFANGILHETAIGLTAIAGGGITTYIGAEDTPSNWDVSKPLLVGLIDGAFTDKQALVYSRWLNEFFNLGLAI